MRAMTRVCIFLLGAMISLALAGCAPEQSLIKRDYRNAAAGKDKNTTGYDENNDFDEVRADANAEKKQRTAGAAQAKEGDESSYKKNKYYETGMASWYGREFHGKKTASGEIFNMNGLTAAHKNLPFGTVVAVKNFDNGKTVSVRINDRGPYQGNRIIDLSYAAAKKIGMLKNGKSNVGIQILRKGSGMEEDEQNGKDGNLEAASDTDDHDGSTTGGNYALQAGAFYSRKNAENLKAKIESLTDNSVVIIHSNDLYKVRIVGMPSKQDATRCKKALSREDIPTYVIPRNE